MKNNIFTPESRKLQKFLRGQAESNSLQFFEWYIAPGVAEMAAGRFFEKPVESEFDSKSLYDLECYVRLCRLLRLDAVPYMTCHKLLHMIPEADPHKQVGDHGAINIAWDDLCKGPFGVGDDFGMIDWQYGISQASQKFLDMAQLHLPEGMKLTVGLCGVMEIASVILGNEKFYLGLYDDPEWMGEFLTRIGDATAVAADEITQHPSTGVLVIGDDMGSNNNLLVSPEILRKWIIPCHKRCVEYAHNRGIPVVLHSCGNVHDIMDDVIDVAQIDAKQSFDDNSWPVEKFKMEYGDRIVTIGGVDMTLLSDTNGTERVRQRTRDIMHACWGDGRYAVGCGHCVATYTPIENVLAMQEEALQFVR